MQQAVLARHQRDERAEGRGLDDGAQVALADLGHRRVGDGVDHRARGLGRRAVGRTDVDRAVVLDRDVGAGLVLDLVDHLALRPDDLADLVDRDLDRDDARRGRRHLVGRVDRLVHDLEDRQARVAGLLQRGAEHRGGDAVELGVELQRGDEVLRAGDLEVHVAEGVLGAEDVGEGDVLGLAVDLVGDQAHRDARDRRAQRHTGVEQRHGRGADRAHRRRAVGAEGLGHLTDRVGELLACDGSTGSERPLGERAVADLAALGRAHAAGLAGGVRREVVVVHVALAGLRGERVELLLHAEHVQRGDAQDLGLAALEQRRAVHPREDLDLGRQRADVGEATAVDADLVAQDALAHELLGDASGALRTAPSRGPRTARRASASDDLLDAVEARPRAPACSAMVSASRTSADGSRSTASYDVVLVVEEDRELGGRLGGLRGELGLRLAQDPDEAAWRPRGPAATTSSVGAVAPPATSSMVLDGGLGLDHHDRDVVTGDAAGDDHVEHGVLELLVGREGDPLAADEGDADGADRAAERQAGELGRHRRGVDRDDVVEVVRG